MGSEDRVEFTQMGRERRGQESRNQEWGKEADRRDKAESIWRESGESLS